MLFTTSSQLIVLILLFFGGLVLGLGLHPGGKKWRKRFKDESGHYAQFRRDADKQLGEANRRIAELEREKAALEAREGASGTPGDVPVPPAPQAPLVPAPAADTPLVAPEPDAVPDAPRNNWFSIGSRPDLGRIRGIDAALKTSLFGLGMTRFEDIVDLSAEDEMALEQRLALPAGYITREQWREQAALLRDGQEALHAERFPPR